MELELLLEYRFEKCLTKPNGKPKPESDKLESEKLTRHERVAGYSTFVPSHFQHVSSETVQLLNSRDHANHRLYSFYIF